MAATSPFLFTQSFTDQRFFWSSDEAFNSRKEKEAVSALKMRINESPKADFFGAGKMPTSKPFSRFFQAEGSAIKVPGLTACVMQ